MRGPIGLMALISASLAFTILACVACGCRSEAEPAAELTELERLESLAFVPAGPCEIALADGSSVDCSTTSALLVERFETSRAEWIAWVEGGDLGAERGAATRRLLERWEPGSGGWPASFMTLAEARAFGTSRGMRLPTAREWMRVAAGTRPQPWPWGRTAARSVANTLELGLGTPIAGGTFEQGRSGAGTHDMLGNVWEWVEGTIPLTSAPQAMRSSPVVPESPLTSGAQDLDRGLAWAMGGSYLYRLRPLFGPDRTDRTEFLHLALDPEHRALDVGMRLVQDAEVFLTARAQTWGSDPATEAGLRAIGRAWGPAAEPLLTELAGRPDAPLGLQWLAAGARE